MKENDSDFSVEFTHFEENEWEKIISQLQDSNLYQTSSYDQIKYGKQQVSQMLIKIRNKVVSAAQVRIVRVPVLGYGIAYVFWGPMWRSFREARNPEIFRQSIRALRNEFSLRQGLVVRIFPKVYKIEDENLIEILKEEGYSPYHSSDINRTLILSLESSLPDLRASLNQKWRNCLNRSEKNNLTLIVGEDETLFDQLNGVYKEMAKRKGLPQSDNINYLKKVQSRLPPKEKLKVFICLSDNEICAGSIFSAIGTTGVYLVGATSDIGMKTNGSYLIQWAYIKWLKENGFSYYDLNGINPEANPGTYRFKSGLAGKQGKEVEFLGKFQTYNNKIGFTIISTVEYILEKYKTKLKNS
jgi:lipid II:glycine glycyltransferase (peptidoglycan interpeptide bridge formation enzyme)